MACINLMDYEVGCKVMDWFMDHIQEHSEQLISAAIYLYGAIGDLETALDIYRLHNSRYPTSEQGLKSLLSIPEVGLIPKNWNGPYIRSTKVPGDSWGNPFRYISNNGRDFEIVSLGADGADGGTDLDADINSSDL
mgnify:CR=1 FL=1